MGINRRVHCRARRADGPFAYKLMEEIKGGTGSELHSRHVVGSTEGSRLA